MLNKGDIDTNIFKAYSIRHAASSGVFRAGVNIETIRATAGWFKNSQEL